MAIIFPASPNTNDTHTEGSITYKWDGAKWIGMGLTPSDRLVEGSNKLEIDASNNLVWTGSNVGIGTASPDETLELFKASGTNLLKVSSQANSTIGIEIEKTGSTTQSWRIADGQTVNGVLEFYDVTDSLTRLSIDGSGRVIVGGGTHAGGANLVVKGIDGTTPNSYAAAAFCRIGANPTSDTALVNLRFSGGATGTNRAAEITVKTDSNWSDGTSQEAKMIFAVASSGGGNTAGNPLMTLKGTGDVEVNRGNIVMANDKGISFIEADDTATGETVANSVLDDYEEGSWTPEVRIETRPASDSPIDNTNGQYVKVGGLVHCFGSFQLNGTPTERSTSRAIELRGFPYLHKHSFDKVSGDIRVTGWETGSTYGTDVYFVIRMISNNQYARIEVIEQSYNGTRNASPVMIDDMLVYFSFTYEAE